MSAGTGKSVTGAHLAYAFALWNRQHHVKNPERMPCVVYCGPSNKSVEVVLSKLNKLACIVYKRVHLPPACVYS